MLKLWFLQIWCAAGIDLTGGQTKDGGSLVGSSSVFYKDAAESSATSCDGAEDAVQTLAAELDQSNWERQEAESLERRLSSLVWIISSASGTHGTCNVPSLFLVKIRLIKVNALQIQ